MRRCPGRPPSRTSICVTVQVPSALRVWPSRMSSPTWTSARVMVWPLRVMVTPVVSTSRVQPSSVVRVMTGRGDGRDGDRRPGAADGASGRPGPRARRHDRSQGQSPVAVPCGPPMPGPPMPGPPMPWRPPIPWPPVPGPPMPAARAGRTHDRCAVAPGAIVPPAATHHRAAGACPWTGRTATPASRSRPGSGWATAQPTAPAPSSDAAMTPLTMPMRRRDEWSGRCGCMRTSWYRGSLVDPFGHPITRT